MAPFFQKAAQCRKDQLQGDEAYVYRGKVQLVGDLLMGEVTGVGPLHAYHPLIAAELPGKLTVANIHGVDLGRAVLEHTIRKTAGRSTDIGADITAKVDGEGGHGLFQLQSAPAHVFQGIAPHFDGRVIQNGGTGLIHLLAIYIYKAAHNGGLGLLAGLLKAPLH